MCSSIRTASWWLPIPADVQRLGRAPLHPIRELVGRDACGQIGVARILLHVELVQLREQIQPGPLLLRADLGRRLQVDDRIAGRAEERPLVGRGDKARAPVVDAAERAAAPILNHHVRRQARVLRTKPVGDPRTDAREPHADLSGLHFVGRLDVVVGLAVDRSHEGNLVDVSGDVREQVRHLEAGLAVFPELERARHQRPRMALAHDDVASDFAVERLSCVLGHAVLGIDVSTGSARHDRKSPFARLECGTFALRIEPVGLVSTLRSCLILGQHFSC